MFQGLSDRFSKTFKKITGRGKLSEKDITKALRDVKNALLEADVAMPVVNAFNSDVKKRALGREVSKSLTPGQTIIKIVKETLTKIMGEANEELDLKAHPPVVILLAGLQGSGKTTSCAKLAQWLKTKQKKEHVMVASTDVYRPAAMDQLKTLADDISVTCFPSSPDQKPLHIAKAALEQAKKQVMDVLIVDTAGRLHIDDEMMEEVKQLHQTLSPTETLFVVDSLTGQDAANTAKAFNDALPLSGVILTKVDGDARGGAALSVRHITGKPIKFMGSGEKTEELQPFHPERVVSRILGMGDMLSLIEEVEQHVDKKQAKAMAKKIKKKGFTLVDFKSQLKQMKKMGGLASLASKLPGMSQMPDHMQSKIMDDKVIIQMDAIIDSMTPMERENPDIINGSRKRRISKGCGVDVPEINKMLKQFSQMQKVMKKAAGKGGMGKALQGLQNKLPMDGGGLF